MIDADGGAMTDNSEVGMSTHTSDRMSAHLQRVEVITRAERRRSWSLEQKQAIVAESLVPNTSVAAVARKHSIGTGLLYKWRGELSVNVAGQAIHFAPVDVVGAPSLVAGPVSGPSGKSPGLIEIMLPGVCVRVDAAVDERALHRVLDVLRR
jgi:transposase